MRRFSVPCSPLTCVEKYWKKKTRRGCNSQSRMAVGSDSKRGGERILPVCSWWWCWRKEETLNFPRRTKHAVHVNRQRPTARFWLHLKSANKYYGPKESRPKEQPCYSLKCSCVGWLASRLPLRRQFFDFDFIPPLQDLLSLLRCRLSHPDPSTQKSERRGKVLLLLRRLLLWEEGLDEEVETCKFWRTFSCLPCILSISST